MKTKSTFGVGPLTMRYLIVMLLAVLSLLYLVQTAQGSDKTNQIRNGQDKSDQLDQQLGTLEVNASRLKSLNIVGSSADKLGLKPADKAPETITIPSH